MTSIKVGTIADLHFDEHSRFDECVSVHDWIAEDMRQRGMDLVILTGDIYERESTPRERMAVASLVHKLAAVAPVVIIRGNHDKDGDLSLIPRYSTRNRVIVEEQADVHFVSVARWDVTVAVGCLSWPRKANLLALAPGVPLATATAEGSDHLRSILRWMGTVLGPHDSGPSILASHAMVRAATTSVGQPLVGCDFELSVEDLMLARADVVLLGHIHKGQDWTAENGVQVIYPGSPRRTAYGEIEPKAYIVSTMTGGERGWRASSERIITPARPMFLIEDEWGIEESGRATWLCGLNGEPQFQTEYQNADVRFRYVVDADRRAAAREAAESIRAYFIQHGAADVKMDPVIRPTTKARAPEIAAAATIEEKLSRLWQIREPAMTPERRERLLAKARTLEDIE